MINMLWVIIGILLGATFFLVYRIYILTQRHRDKTFGFKRLSANDTSARLLLAFAILFLGGFWVYFFLARPELLPEAASDQGAKIDGLFYVAIGVILAPFTIFNFLLFFAAYKFRSRKGRSAHFYPKNIKIEIGWTLATASVLIALIWWGSGIWNNIRSQAPENAEIINIMGYQFAWGLRYPGPDNKLGKRNYQLTSATNDFGLDLTDPDSYDDFTAFQLHLPVDKPVLLEIISRDVIHSVFLPHFRIKMDAVPGMPTKFWFTPKYTTSEMRVMTGNPDFNYELACTELCGRNHYVMKMIVVVDEQEDYEKWKASQTSWLRQNPEYMDQVPEHLREVARIKSGIERNELLVTK